MRIAITKFKRNKINKRSKHYVLEVQAINYDVIKIN